MHNRIEIYKTTKGNEIRVKLEEDTIWLTQVQMSELFDKDIRTINVHIQNIYKTDELPTDPTIRKFRIVPQEGTKIGVRREEETSCSILEQVCKESLHTTPHGAISGKTQTKKTKLYNVTGYAINENRHLQ